MAFSKKRKFKSPTQKGLFNIQESPMSTNIENQNKTLQQQDEDNGLVVD